MIEVLSKPVDRIGIDDFDSLIALKVPESEQIEFKATLPTKKRNADPWASGKGRVGDYARNAVLEEATAFANAFGGTLLIGIRESDVRPSAAEAIAPVPRCAELSERLKLMFRDCVELPLPSFEITGVPIQEDSGVVVIRVGKSRLAPHRVTTTLRCPIRRQDRCEQMTMREIQDMTLNMSKGLERLERRLQERADRFPREFDQLADPHSAFGIRMTALPVGDEVRFDHVYSRHDILEELREPWRRVTETTSSGIRRGLNDLPHESRPKVWRPMLRAARAEVASTCASASRGLEIYREIHCDGLIEWGLLSSERSPKEETTCPLMPDWPVVLLANLIAWTHRVRDQAGVPLAEYAADVELCVQGPNVKVANPGFSPGSPWLGTLAAGSTKFPRYSLGSIDEFPHLMKLFRRDFLNSLGKDAGGDEGVLEIEDWPGTEANQEA